MIEPTEKRAVSFFDGQNLYHHAKAAFGHHHPNYDPIKLANAICVQEGWKQSGVRFYTGTPIATKSPTWQVFWANRLLAMRRAGILVTSRPLRYRDVKTLLPDGTESVLEVADEKGIDVRLCLDVIRLALANQFDVAIIFSQDQDLAEVVVEIKELARDQNRWIKVVSAFPVSGTATAARGINGADWIKMDQAFYDACLDPRDYRPKAPHG